MYLNEVTAFVTVGSNGWPQLSVKAWLICPVCRTPDAASSGQIPIVKRSWLRADNLALSDTEVSQPRRLPVEEYRGQLATAFKQHRKCEVCGTISGLPEKGLKRLDQEMDRRITAEWIVSQITTLYSSAAHADRQAPAPDKVSLPSLEP